MYEILHNNCIAIALFTVCSIGDIGSGIMTPLSIAAIVHSFLASSPFFIVSSIVVPDEVHPTSSG